MRIFLSVGHSLLKSGVTTSADGYVNEYFYNKRLGAYLSQELKKQGHYVDLIICPERKFTRSYQEKTYKLNIANNGRYDLVVELHLNSFNSQAHGSEVFYYTGDRRGKKIASAVCSGLEGLGFRNRGAKPTRNLYMVSQTYPTAILIESFFCDNSNDCRRATEIGVQKMASTLARAIGWNA